MRACGDYWILGNREILCPDRFSLNPAARFARRGWNERAPTVPTTPSDHCLLQFAGAAGRFECGESRKTSVTLAKVTLPFLSGGWRGPCLRAFSLNPPPLRGGGREKNLFARSVLGKWRATGDRVWGRGRVRLSQPPAVPFLPTFPKGKSWNCTPMCENLPKTRPSRFCHASYTGKSENPL